MAFRDVAELEAHAQAFNDNKELFKQMASSLRAAINELSGSIRRHRASAEKAKRTAAKQEAEDGVKKQQTDMVKARRDVLANVKGQLFTVELAGDSATRIRQFSNDEEYVSARDADVSNVLTQPFVLKQGEALSTALTGDCLFAKTLARWDKQYHRTHIFVSDGSVTAPLLPTMHGDELAKVTNLMVPVAHQLGSKAEWFASAMKAASLFGYAATYQVVELGKALLGTLVGVASGTLKVVLINAAEAVAAFMSIHTTVETIDVTSLRAWLLTGSPYAIKALSEKKVSIVHGTISKGYCMYAPAVLFS